MTVIPDQTVNVDVDYAPAGGTLAVSVTGLPTAVDAEVTVTGPSSFSQAVTSSEVLTDLEPGVYMAAANSVSDGTNTFTPTVTGPPAEVPSSDLA